MSVTIFGIRHHGPGSAKSLLQSLQTLAPDIILVEGPPDADDLIPIVANAELKPPVSLLIYSIDNAKYGVYYPFAIFSPEWQALNYSVEHKIPARFIDLPQTYRLLIEKDEDDLLKKLPQLIKQDRLQAQQLLKVRRDPLAWLAEAAGYDDSERWWEDFVEHRRDSNEIFTAIMEMMTELRAAYKEELTQLNLILDNLTDEENTQDINEDDNKENNKETNKENSKKISSTLLEEMREAHMRQAIRKAQKEGFTRIAVVCGAWHAPAINISPSTKNILPTPKEDAALLKGLTKTKVNATWVPWTYGRLTFDSGYGAGILSPGWYQHLWQLSSANAREIIVKWFAKVAFLLREKDIDVSVSHTIEAVRLAESLASLRSMPIPSLNEINDAIQAIYCFGSNLPMKLIETKLLIGEQMGSVPADTPMVPLQRDLISEQKRLRMNVSITETILDLDLRKLNDLARSYLLHRLSLLSIYWGELQITDNKQSTFHELWELKWHPELALPIIEAAIWGNTVFDAANNYTCHLADKCQSLPELTELVHKTLLANLPDGVNYVMALIKDRAALTADINHLMEALPPLANIVRYGNVRNTDVTMVSNVIDGLVIRITIGLQNACTGLNDDAAQDLLNNIDKVHNSISILNNPAYNEIWQQQLLIISDKPAVHPLISGRVTRIIMDGAIISNEETQKRLNMALSVANVTIDAANWLSGFLRGSGLLLLHDDQLRSVIDDWVCHHSDENFLTSLPLLRRTFANFSTAERRQIGESLRQQQMINDQKNVDEKFDYERAEKILPLLNRLLGFN